MSEVKTHRKSLLRAEDRRRLNCKYCETSGAEQKIYTGVESLLQHCQREHPNQDVLHGSINEEPAYLFACSYCEQEFGSMKSYTNHRAKNYDPKCKAASAVEIENPFFNKPLLELTMPSRSRNTPRAPRAKRTAPPPILADNEPEAARVSPETINHDDGEATELADTLVRMSDPDFADTHDNSVQQEQASSPPTISKPAAVIAEHVAKKPRIRFAEPTPLLGHTESDESAPPPLKPIQLPPRAVTTGAAPVVVFERGQRPLKPIQVPLRNVATGAAPAVAFAAKTLSVALQTSNGDAADAVQPTASKSNTALMQALSDYAGDDLVKWAACLKMVGVTDLSQALNMEYGFKRLLLSGPSCVEYAPIINAINELRNCALVEEIAALRRSLLE